MITQARFLGSSEELALTSNKALKAGQARIQIVTPDAGGRTLTLPDARTLRMGGPASYILNKSGANAFDLKDGASGALVSLPAEDGAIVALADNSTQAGIWLVRVTDIGGI